MFYKPTVAIGADIMAPKYPSRGYSDSAVNNEYVNVLTVINVDYSGDVFVSVSTNKPLIIIICYKKQQKRVLQFSFAFYWMTRN